MPICQSFRYARPHMPMLVQRQMHGLLTAGKPLRDRAHGMSPEDIAVQCGDSHPRECKSRVGIANFRYRWIPTPASPLPRSRYSELLGPGISRLQPESYDEYVPINLTVGLRREIWRCTQTEGSSMGSPMGPPRKHLLAALPTDERALLPRSDAQPRRRPMRRSGLPFESVVAEAGIHLLAPPLRQQPSAAPRKEFARLLPNTVTM
jgi:hypothetical protein